MIENHTVLSTAIAGFLLGLSLIAAIGAQNLFVLRQGLLGRHVLLCVAFCSAADATLAMLGVAGMAQLLLQLPRLSQLLALAGALFLLVYAALSLRRAWLGSASGGKAAAGTNGSGHAHGSSMRVLAQLAAFTLLNPHVYLDTVVLIGGIGAQQPAGLKWVYVLGTSCAALLWFATLGFGARWLKPWFERPAAWRALDTFTACTMLVLAAGLLRPLMANA